MILTAAGLFHVGSRKNEPCSSISSNLCIQQTYSSGGGGIGGGGSSFFQPAGRALEIALKVNLAAISNFYLFIL
jgi:hypothetical protein